MDIKQLLAGLNILLVDDEALGIDSVLTRVGARVVTCSSIEQAQMELGAHAFQVALIDQNLGMSRGIQLALWLYEHRPDVVRISLSGRNADDIRRTLPPDKPDLYAAYLVTAPRAKALDFYPHVVGSGR
jgi:CheY-like chemotaxis protein